MLDYSNKETYYENVTFSQNECIRGQGGDL